MRLKFLVSDWPLNKGMRDMRQLFARGGAFFLLISAMLLPVAPVSAADWLYTVRPGDKLWNLAEKYCGSYTYWRDIASHNQLTQPTRLTPGTRLKFPLAWLKEEPAAAQVIYASGTTKLARADGSSTEGLQPGDSLTAGDTLITGEESYANVEFADGSTLQIGPESELVFDTLSAFGDTGMVDSRVRVNRGSAESEINPQIGPGSVYRISTPLGVAAVRGTKFRTRAEGEASFVETVEGAVEYTSGSKTTDVAKGLGLKQDPQGIVVEELLAPPVLSPREVYANNELIEWSDLAGAATYSVRVYSGADSSELVGSASVPSAAYELTSLEPGDYTLGVSGVSAVGLQGFEAARPLQILARLNAPQNLVVQQTSSGGNLVVRWDGVSGAQEYRVVVQPAKGGKPIVRTTKLVWLELKDLEEDSYSLSVQAKSDEIEGVISAPIAGEISVPVEAELENPQRRGFFQRLFSSPVDS